MRNAEMPAVHQTRHFDAFDVCRLLTSFSTTTNRPTMAHTAKDRASKASDGTGMERNLRKAAVFQKASAKRVPTNPF
jgi:hypothetical protein